MDFNVKKLVGDAGSFLSRAVQMTEELVGSTNEITAYDSQLENLIQQVDCTRSFTQRMVKDFESVVVPNPGNRVEDYLLEKMEKRRPTRPTNIELLGNSMVEAGSEFGQSSAYGSLLTKVGSNSLKLGQAERAFTEASVHNFMNPLVKFMETEVKNSLKERKLLENKRLDLDAAKSRLKKARGMTTAKDGVDPLQAIQQAERDVSTCQSEFTLQCDVTRSSLDAVLLARDRHVEHLKQLVQAQREFYEKCHFSMIHLCEELGRMPLSNVNLEQSFSLDEVETPASPGAKSN